MARLALLAFLTALAAPASAASYHVWPVSPQQVVLPQSPPAQVAVLQRLEGLPDFAGFHAHAAQDFSMRGVGHPGPGRKNNEIHRQPGGDRVEGEQ